MQNINTQGVQQQPAVQENTALSATTGLEEDWKTKLRLPPKDLRPKTEVYK